MSKTCDKCGNEKKMYYSLWCPTCDTPKMKPVVILNFIQVLVKFCVSKGYAEHATEYDQIWSWACDHCIITGNDSYSTADLSTITEEIDEYVYPHTDTHNVEYVKEFFTYVGELYEGQLDQTILWEISW
jgi:hypothetical protein